MKIILAASLFLSATLASAASPSQQQDPEGLNGKVQFMRERLSRAQHNQEEKNKALQEVKLTALSIKTRASRI